MLTKTKSLERDDITLSSLEQDADTETNFLG